MACSFGVRGVGIEWVGIGCLEHFLKTQSLVIDHQNLVLQSFISYAALVVLICCHFDSSTAPKGFSVWEFEVGSFGLRAFGNSLCLMSFGFWRDLELGIGLSC